MLHPFVSCPASDRRSNHPVLFSAVFHAVLFGIVIAPSRPARLSTLPRTSAESVRYLSLSLDARHAGAGSLPRHPRRSSHRKTDEAPRLPSLPRLDLAIAFDIALPEPWVPELKLAELKDSLPGDPVGEIPYDTPVRRLRGAGAAAHAGRADSEAFLAGEVDRTAMALGSNPKPCYPMALLRQGVEATFTTFYVVDTTGRVDRASIQIPSTVDARFGKAVRDVLVRWHFLPAESGGRRVRQSIQQSFAFRVVTRGRHEDASNDERP